MPEAIVVVPLPTSCVVLMQGSCLPSREQGLGASWGFLVISSKGDIPLTVVFWPKCDSRTMCEIILRRHVLRGKGMQAEAIQGVGLREWGRGGSRREGKRLAKQHPLCCRSS